MRGNFSLLTPHSPFMTLNKIENAFFELLRIALGTQEKMTVALNDAEWKDVAQMAVKQSVLGILFTAVETLPEEQRPYNDLYIDMYKWVDTIEQRNEHMNKLTASVSNRFRKDGFPNCILKGQGVALLYPKPLRRHSGDIDIWLKGERKDIYKYVKTIKKDAKSSYHQIKFTLKGGTLLEVHYTPSVSYNPFINSRLQKWFEKQHALQIQNTISINSENQTISVPTSEFNAVYMLHHSLRHLLSERLSMKQVIDYFYVLNNLSNNSNTTASSFTQIQKEIDDLGMTKFSASLSWIMWIVLGLPKEKLITHPHEKSGQKLIRHIIDTSDKKVTEDEADSQFSKDFNNAKPFFTTYPNEALWYPLLSLGSKVWHFFKENDNN